MKNKRSKDVKENLVNTLFNDLEANKQAQQVKRGSVSDHTPTPEIINDIKHCMEMYPEEEVAFIVRAVNAHEELLSASKALVEKLFSLPPNDVTEDAIDVLQQAIAKAEGK